MTEFGAAYYTTGGCGETAPTELGMTLESDHRPEGYDAVVIGSGVGGGTVALELANAGANVLMLERGGYIETNSDLADPAQVFGRRLHKTDEPWFDKNGKPFLPGAYYKVGGNSTFYGAALLRMQPNDFGESAHYSGVSPAWPVNYRDMEPYYQRAEVMYDVHGDDNPVEYSDAWRRKPFPHPPVSHEPFMRDLVHKLEDNGVHPFHLPLGIRINEAYPDSSLCRRCNTCDAFGCMFGAKADAYTSNIVPGQKTGKLTVLPETFVTRLETDPSGGEITAVHAIRNGEPVKYSGDIVVVAAGAANSAALLLRSANEKHPGGLANSSDVVGRHYMSHVCSTFVLGLTMSKHGMDFTKTMAWNDWYWGDEKWPYPMGHIQAIGRIHGEILRSKVPFAPISVLNRIADHALAFSATSEDLPWPDNRITLGPNGEINLNYTLREQASHTQLVRRFRRVMRKVGVWTVPSQITLRDSGHQSGTVRMGIDPRRSALDPDCKAWDLDNLYVADASVFPSSAATNPALTVCANALRVSDAIRERIGR